MKSACNRQGYSCPSIWTHIRKTRVAALAPAIPPIHAGLPSAAPSCNCWQSAHGKALASAARVGDDAGQRYAWHAANRTELHRKDGQRLTGITGVVVERTAAHSARLLLSTHANHKRTARRVLGGMQDCHRASSRDDHPAVGKADPLVRILTKKRISHRPVFCFVFPPNWVDLFGDLRRQFCNRIFHAMLQSGFPYSTPTSRFQATLSAKSNGALGTLSAIYRPCLIRRSTALSLKPTPARWIGSPVRAFRGRSALEACGSSIEPVSGGKAS